MFVQINVTNLRPILIFFLFVAFLLAAPLPVHVRVDYPCFVQSDSSLCGLKDPQNRLTLMKQYSRGTVVFHPISFRSCLTGQNSFAREAHPQQPTMLTLLLENDLFFF